MRILMFSRDEKIFSEESAVSARMVEYGALFDELHIVVLSKKRYKLQATSYKLANNVWIYPTNSRNLFFALFDAYKIGIQIIGNWKLEIGNSRNDVVITSQDPFETGFVAAKIAKKLNVKLQIQIHADFLSPYFRRKSIKNFIRSFIVKRVLLKADCIRVVNKHIFDSLAELRIKNYESRTSILPIFVDAEKIKNAAPKPFPKKFDFTILWVGRLEKEKNCSLAIDAFVKFLKNHPNAGLVIIGTGSLRKRLELQATSYKLQARILFLGWQNDIVGYHKSADVLLVTSDYEGYGLQMVEARIAGIPVIAPDVGVAKEVGVYIADHTADGMARMLSRLHDGSLSKPADYEYPYENKEEYLQLYKQSFEQCLSR